MWEGWGGGGVVSGEGYHFLFFFDVSKCLDRVAEFRHTFTFMRARYVPVIFNWLPAASERRPACLYDPL